MTVTDDKIFVGNAGFNIILTVCDQAGSAADISGATTKKILLRKPDCSIVEKTAVFVNTGTDGKVKYLVERDVLDQSGDWGFKAEVDKSGVVGSGGYHYESSWITETVHDRWT